MMVGQTKVFVGSLPQGSKPEELRKLFERFGVVTECDIMNRCGFVHMQTEEQATAAIRDLHNSTFNGGVITVERGRIKDRAQRGGRGGMRGGMRGSDRRGGMRGGPPRDAPYPAVRDRGMGGPMRGPPMGGGMGMRNGGGYDRGMDRAPMGGASYGSDDRYNGYGGEDRRGFALMDNRGARDPYAPPAPMDSRGARDPYAAAVPMDSRGARDPYAPPAPIDYRGTRDPYAAPAPMDSRGARDPYAAPAPMYPDERRSYAPPVDDMAAMYPEERRATMSSGYDRAPPPRAAPMGNGDMYSRRADPTMRPSTGAAGYERDPYAQQYPPMGRW